MGNDPLRTGYVVSDHLVIPSLYWITLNTQNLNFLRKSPFFTRCHCADFLAHLAYPKHIGDDRELQEKAYLYPDTTYHCHNMA